MTVNLFPTFLLSSKSLSNAQNSLYSSFEMHKQSQRQKRTKTIICPFKELSCLRETWNSGRSVRSWAMQATQPPRSPDAPAAAQAQVLSDLLCLGIYSKALPLLTTPEGKCYLPTQPRKPLHINPGHMLTAGSILHAHCTSCNLERQQPQARPLATVTRN